MKYNVRALLASLVVACAGCDRSTESFAPAMGEAELAQSHAVAPGQGYDTSSARTKSERQIIRSAQITLRVDSPKQITTSLARLAASEGGFVVDSSLSVHGEDALFAENTLRVPAERFDKAMEAIRAMGEVSEERIGGEDVTDQIVDLEVRLRTQRELEARFLGLLAQTNDVGEILKVETELARVRTEIERMDGERAALAERVRLATIRVSLRMKRDLGVQGRTLSSELSEALEDGRDGFVMVLAGLIRAAIALTPILVILAALGFSLRWALRRRRARWLAERVEASKGE